MEALRQKFSFNLALTESGKLVELNLHDSGHAMGQHDPIAEKMGHIKTRLYLWLTLSGLAGVYSLKQLIAARKAYMSLDGHSFALDGNPPYEDAYLQLGKCIHCDVYGSKEVKYYLA